ncbi:GH116 family glycosyl-hydrolase [Candidatus Latescibacterota bacterium]
MSPLSRRTFMKTSALVSGMAAVNNSTTSVAEPVLPDPMVYTGERLQCVAMPLGGIGTGTVALCGDGSLRQWQIFNNINHLAFLPCTHFILQTGGSSSPPRILQSAETYDIPYEADTHCITDYVVPPWLKKILETYRGVDRITYTGEYPFARLNYHLTDSPVDISLEAFNPMIPGNVNDSGIPVILFTFTLKNTGKRTVTADLWATMQNGVGFDGVSTINGIRNQGYGGNQNNIVRLPKFTAVTMTNGSIEPDDNHYGTMALGMLGGNVRTVCGWNDLDRFMDRHVTKGDIDNRLSVESSPEGETWNGAVSRTLRIPGGESRSVTAMISWSFPNQFNEWGQPGRKVDDRKTKFYVGRDYNNRYPDALSVMQYTQQNYDRLEQKTRYYHDSMFDSTLPREVLSRVSSQASLVRCPSTFIDEKGTFYGFEGCNMAVADWWAGPTGGCCPLNCTHVWHYAQTAGALYPSLEESMQETALESQMMADGCIPHRTNYPLYLNNIPDLQIIGGPDEPALDGMFGVILRTYRQVRRGASDEWLRERWSELKKLQKHLFEKYDPEATGIIVGSQAHTYDQSAYGANTFIGSLWLAGLRAMEVMADMRGETALSKTCRSRFRKGVEAYDNETWKEDYYIQVVDWEKHPNDNWGDGCLSDHLMGQWWAYMLDLGDILPREHVCKAVESIMKYNYYDSLPHIPFDRRMYASDGEPGLLMCTWPHGGRPERPVRYRDEVWTGIEYEVAALLIYEGMVEDGLRIVSAVDKRHDGIYRNPFNETECGDHYIRAMSSWSVLEALSGFLYDHPSGSIEFGPRLLSGTTFKSFFTGGGAWGSYSQDNDSNIYDCRLEVRHGKLLLNEFALRTETGRKGNPKVKAAIGGTDIPSTVTTDNNKYRVAFKEPVTITAGNTLIVLFE